MRQDSRRKSRLKWKYKAILIICILILALFQVNRLLSVVVDGVVDRQIHNYAVNVINQTITQILEDRSLMEESLISVHYDDQQNVRTIETNTTAVNRIRSEITSGVVEELQQFQVQPVQIPLGSLTDIRYFNARGPMIDFAIYPVGYLNTKILSDFSSAGINQTRHQLLISLSIDINCAGMLQSKNMTVQSEYILAETIIVGEIPDSYSKILFEGYDEVVE